MHERRVAVIGAGLAGAEAADRLTRYGIRVDLYEMKPVNRSPAHTGDGFAELVCSNSLRSDRLENAVGLLKEEMPALRGRNACSGGRRTRRGSRGLFPHGDGAYREEPAHHDPS